MFKAHPGHGYHTLEHYLAEAGGILCTRLVRITCRGADHILGVTYDGDSYLTFVLRDHTSSEITEELALAALGGDDLCDCIRFYLTRSGDAERFLALKMRRAARGLESPRIKPNRMKVLTALATATCVSASK